MNMKKYGREIENPKINLHKRINLFRNFREPLQCVILIDGIFVEYYMVCNNLNFLKDIYLTEGMTQLKQIIWFNTKCDDDVY